MTQDFLLIEACLAEAQAIRTLHLIESLKRSRATVIISFPRFLPKEAV